MTTQRGETSKTRASTQRVTKADGSEADL